MRCCLSAAITLLFVASPSIAAEDPLDAFPAETGVVLRIGAPSATSGKAKGFLNNAAPRYAQAADSLAPALGSLIGNPTLAGIDPNGDWYVAVLPRPEQSPSLVYAVPASNTGELKKAVGQGYTFAEFDKWVVYSLDADAVSKSSATKPETSVRTILSEPLQKIFNEGEIAIVLNAISLKKTYRGQIDRAKEQMIKAAGSPPPGVQSTTAPQIGQEYNRKVIENLMKTVDDARVIAKHVSIADEELKVEALATFEPGSDSAKFVASQKPSQLPLLKKLPAGRLLYYDLAGDFSRLISASAKMTLASYPMNEKLQSLAKELENVRVQEFAGAFGLGDLQGGVVRGISLAKVESPEEYQSLVRRMVEALGSADTGHLQQEMSIKPDAETIEGTKVDLVKVKWMPDKEVPNAKATTDAMEIMFGKDGMTQRIGVVDGLFVQAIGDASVMSTAIKSIRRTTADDDAGAKAAAKTREELQGDANLVVLSDLPRVLSGALQVAIESKRLPLPIDVAAIENIDLSPSYAGVAVVTEEDAIRFRGLIPAEQVRGFIELVNVLQKAAPQRGRAN
jgi:hypothetical protein